MISQPPTSLRIMLAGLPPADRERVRAFLTIGSERLRHRWELVDAGPVHVYVHDADQMPTIPGTLDRMPRLLRVVPAGSPVPDFQDLLLRPIQFEPLVDALVEAERQFGAAAATPPGAPRVQPAQAAAAPRAMPSLVRGHRFKLRRWPPASQLRASRYGQRMASFLSSRFLSASELSELSGASPADCEEFLSTMLDAQLLMDVPAEPSSAADPRHPRNGAAHGDAPAPRPSRALLASLRDKLGIRRA